MSVMNRQILCGMLRTARGLHTQQEMADLIEINRVNYVMIERGHYNISPRVAVALERITGRSAIKWLHDQAAVDLLEYRMKGS